MKNASWRLPAIPSTFPVFLLTESKFVQCPYDVSKILQFPHPTKIDRSSVVFQLSAIALYSNSDTYATEVHRSDRALALYNSKGHYLRIKKTCIFLSNYTFFLKEIKCMKKFSLQKNWWKSGERIFTDFVFSL